MMLLIQDFVVWFVVNECKSDVPGCMVEFSVVYDEVWIFFDYGLFKNFSFLQKSYLSTHSFVA